ncbi:terminase large subunit [Neolewinella antarctica]|uniref:Phage terminase large subunit-like protein n=1 Tax=Neolewinella antarctica TaxID=442734 RepID=A0ABX0X6F7_9BACT|nr:terminase TerL endonuclease subunit [Neolewinella antarctica]NJC24790.1 phage terminase large subunit-like protein [Neolewinella antarctica]
MPDVPGWARYMTKVLDGERKAGRRERLCVERCVRLANKEEYYFDFDEAERVIEIVGLFRHTKGTYAGEIFEMMDWQEFFLVMIFALKKVKNDLRVFRKSILCVSKKNGKTEFAAAIANIFTFFDDEEGAECYSAANKYDQAEFSWIAAKKMMTYAARESEWVNQTLKVYDSTVRRSIINTESDSWFKPMAADAKTMDGVNPHLCIVDEYHEAKDSAIPDNMESGMVSREQPMLLITTTRGFNINGPLWRFEKSCDHILEGTVENDDILPLIFCLDDDDDWEDESLWEKANPGLGRTPTMSGLQTEFRKAQTEGALKEISFKTKNLNIWTSVASRWVKDKDYMSGASDWKPEDVEGLLCFGGLDLAKTRDITCAAYLFPPQAGFDRFRVLMRHYVPEENAQERSRKDLVPYLDWAEEGWITTTPGNVADYDHILAGIIADSKYFNLRGMSYDPWNAAHLATQAHESGILMSEFAQRASKFSEPIHYMLKAILKGELDHRNDPVLRWMFGNIVTYTDGNGNVKFDKGKSREKIDGAVALAMAFGEYLNYKLVESPDFGINWQ